MVHVVFFLLLSIAVIASFAHIDRWVIYGQKQAFVEAHANQLQLLENNT